MNLTDRAARYLRKQKRNWGWKADSFLTESYLKSQLIPPFESIVAFESNYSGYYLTIKGKPQETFTISLFSKIAILFKQEIKFIQYGDEYYFPCGEHQSAQLNFCISNRGNICINDEPMQIISSSIEKFIEQYAKKDEINNWFELPYYYDLESPELLEMFLNLNQYQLIPECSDLYNQWYGNDSIIFTKATWWANTGFCIHIYAATEKQANIFAEQLANKNIIRH